MYMSAEILMPGKFEPLWCVEFARGRRRAVAHSCGGTLLRSLLPWRFWKQLRMSHRPQARRLIFYACALLLPLSLLIVFLQIAAAVFEYNSAQSQMRGQLGYSVWYSNVLTTELATLEEGSEEHQERIEWINDHLAILQKTMAAPKLNLTRTGAIMEAVLTPWKNQSSGIYTFADGSTVPYTAPSALWPSVQMRLGGVGIFELVMWQGFLFELSLSHLLLTLLAYSVLPLTFALLPLSRRKSKVRWSHIARVAVYGLYLPLAALWIGMFCAMLVLVELDAFAVRAMGSAVVLGLPVLTALWWMFAIRHYLRMPHAAFVSAMLMLLTLLLLSSVMWVTLEWPVVPDSWWSLL